MCSPTTTTTTTTTDLSGFIDIEDQLGWVAAKEDDDDGEEKSNHGGVTPVASADSVVEQGHSEEKIRNSIVNEDS